SPVAYLRPAFAVSQETQKGLLRNVLRVVMVAQHRVRNFVNEPGLFPNCGLELVPAGISCRNGLAQNHLPGIDHRGPLIERRHYPLKRSDKSAPLSIGNRQSKIANTSPPRPNE